MNIYMLCGQGSSGKSTFGKRLQKERSNTAFIRMDNYNSFDLNRFYNDIQKVIDNNYENIIIDLALDTIKTRKHLLSNLSFSNHSINFYCISMRPGWVEIAERQAKRQNKPLTAKEKEEIKSVYQSFQYPTFEEFKSYNFNTITLITRRINMTKILIEDRQFINELEALQVDTQCLQSLIAYMTDSDCDMSSDNFKKIYAEYKNTYWNYENKKLELEKRFIYPVIAYPKDWNLNFASGELIVND